MDDKVLREAFIIKRKGLGLREAGKEVGLSASTLSRFENGIGTLDSDSYGRIAAFLEVPISADAEIRIVKDTLQEIENVIFSDKTLTPQARSGLSQLMNVAYRGLLKLQQEEQTCQ